MKRAPGSPLPDGLLVVDKAAGPTSHDVVQEARRALGLRRIGHTGTLDPMATGVLVLMLGQATRLAPQMAGHIKTYTGEGRLGWATDTYDRTGRAAGPPSPPPPADRVREEAAHLSGRIRQLPPPYSARKVDGVPLYRHARQGRKVAGRATMVEVLQFAVDPDPDGRIRFSATVSAGTYIRSLVHDLGQRLGCGAHLTALRRVQAGPFRIQQALPQADLVRVGPDSPALVPFHRIPLELCQVRVGPEDEASLRQGRPFRAAGPALSPPGSGAATVPPQADGEPADPPLVQVRDGAGNLVALAAPDPEHPGWMRPRRVFMATVDALTPPGPDASVSGNPREK